MKDAQGIYVKTGLQNNFYNDNFVQKQMEFINNMNQVHKEKDEEDLSDRSEEDAPIAIYYGGKKIKDTAKNEESMLSDLRRQMEFEEEQKAHFLEQERLRQIEEQQRDEY